MGVPLVSNYGVSRVERVLEPEEGPPQRVGQVLAQVRCAVLRDGSVDLLVAVDSARRVLLAEKVSEYQQEPLRSATPARVYLADGSIAIIKNAGCGCGSPLKSMDIAEVYEGSR